MWIAMTPVEVSAGVSAPRAYQPAPAVRPDTFAAFDPFFRLSGNAGPVQVTSLNIKLFGVREDRASGRGSAIISTPEGQQQSFTVGDEIAPGVQLTAVNFDSVTITRNGATEQLFLDQSQPATVAGGAAPPHMVPPPPQSPPPPVTQGTGMRGSLNPPPHADVARKIP